MLTPTILNVVLPFYAVGDSPAVTLTRNVPQGVDADILLLGSGDVRHILYTAYHEKGLPTRKLDITSCDLEDVIIVFFLTLLVSRGMEVEPQLLWNVYYHLFLDEESAQVLQSHIVRLVAASSTLKDWRESEFGENFRFGTASTLSSVRHIWHDYLESLQRKDQDQYRADFETALKHSNSYKDATIGSQVSGYGMFLTAAPFGPQALASVGMRIALDSWWEKGTTGPVPANTNIPNSLFAATLSKHSVLAYGGRPILSYHLATANAHFTEGSPLRSDRNRENASSLAIIATAQTQFADWSRAFVERASGYMTFRFISADALSLCHTLQHHLETGELSGHFYRRQLTMEPLELDPDEYGMHSKTPKQFDVIDTSNLSLYLGTLNLLVSGSPLLKATPWATLYTEMIYDQQETEKANFEELLCGRTRTVASLLGISPVEYWSNATAVSNVDEYMLAVSDMGMVSKTPGMLWRFAWKSHEHLSGHTGQALRLKVNDDALVDLVHKVYLAMFASEDVEGLLNLSSDQMISTLRKHGHPRYHRGSLVAFIRRLLQTVDASKEAVCRKTLAKLTQDTTFLFGSKYSQALSLEFLRQGLYILPGLQQGIRRGPSAPLFSRWPDVPEAVAVTIVIPAASWKELAQVARDGKDSYPVEVNLRGVQGGVTMWHHVFSDVQVTFGTISTTGDRQGGEFTLAVNEDPKSWSGGSNMIATFSVPAAALQVDPRHTRVSLCLLNRLQTSVMFGKKLPHLLKPGLGEPMTIYETDLEDNAHVYVSKNQPGLDGFPLYNNLEPKTTQETTGDHKSCFTANIDASGVLTTITGRLDISSQDGKALLADKAAVDVRKILPFMFEVVLGEREAVYPLCFPLPVVKDGSKTRIARTSAYVEVIAPLADPATAQTLDDFVFPSVLAKPDSSSSLGQTMPVPLNIPHVNLDNLPVLDVTDKKRLVPLTTLTSWMFSVRERKLRDEADESGLATSARMNFKESLFTMFMLASGLQGGQTGLFAIHHPEKGGIHMLLFVSAIRLDGANASIALDAAVIPFTVDIIKSGKLEAFLLILRELECATITVDDEELVLWKKVLAALAERCRNWTHTSECEYARPGAAVPLSTEPGKQVLCSCGAGKLPENFISLPEWDVAAQFATRIAISPTYAVPFVEDVIDPSAVRNTSGFGMSVQGDETVRCRSCGNMEAKGGGALKKFQWQVLLTRGFHVCILSLGKFSVITQDQKNDKG
ncbi:hypothetical protein LA080_010012 [Diaporthe eres]|nr:hypothetical protein LA080_010012 [Diaporthe eres]